MLKKFSKKFIASLIMSIIVLAQFSNYRFESEAAVITTGDQDNLYLALSETNPESDDGWGYSIGNPGEPGGNNIWNIVSYETATSTEAKNGSNLYCIKAEYGTTWEDNAKPGTRVTYNKSYDLSSLTTLVILS